MSRLATACWLVTPGHAELREQTLPILGAGDALVRTLYSGLSRGTESTVFTGRVPQSEHQRMRAPFQEGDFPGPLKYGYISVGVVEAGPERLVGERVFCLYPHQNYYQVDADALAVLPAALPAERAVLAAGMETALNALWDAEIKIGDRVAVIGAGVIGSLIAYLAGRVAGTDVTLVDINPGRSQLADALGVQFALSADLSADLSAGRMGEVDLVLHASSSGAGLELALSLAGQESRIIELSWYGDQAVSVPLGGAFHSRRLLLQSSQVGQIPPSQAARWTYKRRMGCALDLLCDPRLDVLISGESAFSALPEDLANICGSSSDVLCHRVRYPLENENELVEKKECIQ